MFLAISVISNATKEFGNNYCNSVMAGTSSSVHMYLCTKCQTDMKKKRSSLESGNVTSKTSKIAAKRPSSIRQCWLSNTDSFKYCRYVPVYHIPNRYEKRSTFENDNIVKVNRQHFNIVCLIFVRYMKIKFKHIKIVLNHILASLMKCINMDHCYGMSLRMGSLIIKPPSKK